MDGNKDLLWYEVSKEYGEFLTDDRADAFIVGLLLYALKNGHDIQVLSRMSERLYYTLNKYLVPIIADINGYKHIKVMCKLLDAKSLSNVGAVGTGLSCGIDSFSTICDHLNVPDHYKITHFTFLNVGSNGCNGGKKAFKLFKKRAKLVKSCAEELGIEFITVNSNLSEILRMDFQSTHTLRSISAVLALQRLFKVYYYSSSIPIKNFELSKQYSDSYDIFSLNMLSTESIELFSACSTLTRVDKTRLVAEFEPSYKYLNVCTMSDFNCGTCPKCLRTFFTLELIGVIDRYKSVFNYEAYLKKRQKFIAHVLKQHHTDVLLKEIYDEMLRVKFKN